jgi:hypothetical protein
LFITGVNFYSCSHWINSAWISLTCQAHCDCDLNEAWGAVSQWFYSFLFKASTLSDKTMSQQKSRHFLRAFCYLPLNSAICPSIHFPLCKQPELFRSEQHNEYFLYMINFLLSQRSHRTFTGWGPDHFVDYTAYKLEVDEDFRVFCSYEMYFPGKLSSILTRWTVEDVQIRTQPT